MKGMYIICHFIGTFQIIFLELEPPIIYALCISSLQKNIHIFTEFNFPQPTTHKKLWFARTSKERIYQISICYHNENSHILEFTCVNYLESDRHSHKDINMNRWGKNSFNSKLQKKKIYLETVEQRSMFNKYIFNE